MRIGKRNFALDNGQCYIMGILNVTPDSFSDGGKWNRKDSALFHVEQMLADGMDIVDVGGESTRPGYEKISDDEEIQRVVPVIEAIKANFDVPISLDTYKSAVAESGIKAGADLINDIWGLKADADMARVIAGAQIPCCLMHNRATTEHPGELITDMLSELQESVDMALAAGILPEHIIVDPGVGFAKTYEDNLAVVKHLEKFAALGYPVLLGCSRKSMIGNALDLPVEERVEGTLVTSVLAVMKKAAFVRVHDVKENARAIKMTQAIFAQGD